jgi:hypothetical protein
MVLCRVLCTQLAAAESRHTGTQDREIGTAARRVRSAAREPKSWLILITRDT